MPPAINHQPPLQPTRHLTILPLPTSTSTRNTPNKRLPHHLRQKNRQRIIIPKPGNLNRHLHPRPLPSSSPILPGSTTLLLLTRFPRQTLPLRLSRNTPQIQCISRNNRLLDFRFHADDRLRPVCEADACATVGSREDVGFGG